MFFVVVVCLLFVLVWVLFLFVDIFCGFFFFCCIFCGWGDGGGGGGGVLKTNSLNASQCNNSYLILWDHKQINSLIFFNVPLKNNLYMYPSKLSHI